jgi:hypothetical protein
MMPTFNIQRSTSSQPKFAMPKDIVYLNANIPHERFLIPNLRTWFSIFYSMHLRPPKEVGRIGDIYLLQTGPQIIIYWKKEMGNGMHVWREVGGNGQSIPHPVHEDLILRGSTCHYYPHWCLEDGDSTTDDLYLAAHLFLRTFGPGSSLSPIDLATG